MHALPPCLKCAAVVLLLPVNVYFYQHQQLLSYDFEPGWCHQLHVGMIFPFETDQDEHGT
jgi:hypothetical protein